MTDSSGFSPDLPELRLIAQLAGIAPSRLAAAFNSPEHFMDFITQEQLDRFSKSLNRLHAVQVQMIAAVDIAIAHQKRT